MVLGICGQEPLWEAVSSNLCISFLLSYAWPLACLALSTLLRGPMRPLEWKGDSEAISPKIFKLHVLEAEISREMFKKTPFPGVWGGETHFNQSIFAFIHIMYYGSAQDTI